jgi:hypothetical protein
MAMVSRRLRGIAAATASIALSGCTGSSSACGNLQFEYAMQVFVQDATSNTDVCDATVVASNATASVTLMVSSPSATDASSEHCYYFDSEGLTANARYTVSVAAPGYQATEVANVGTNSDGPCGNGGDGKVSVALEPSM